MALDPRTPVLVGVGAVRQREKDLARAKEPVELMIDALTVAAEDAGSRALLERADQVIVPKGIWTYADPGRIIADRFGAPARTVLADVGILQQTPFTLAAHRIATGLADVVLVTGGEAKYRSLRAKVTGAPVDETTQAAGTGPDEVLEPHGEIISRLEIERGLAVPAHQYAVMESALRFADGVSPQTHARELAELQSSFSRVAADNPDAWDRDAVPPESLLTPTASNRMVALPYTKLHCSQWNVDLAAGHILCSVEAATRHAIPRERWVFPIAAAESNTMIPLSARAELHRSPAFAIAGERLFEGADRTLDDVAHLDLYSCFPAAVRIQARELGVPAGRPLTVTGGMTFAGGPLNNYVVQAIVAMARTLRDDPGSLGLVTSISGMITKQGLGLWSTEPPERGFSVDVSDEVAMKTATVPVTGDYEGAAEIAGYTIVFDAGHPVRAIVIATLPSGEHTIATTDDPDAAAAMVDGEWCGRVVRVAHAGRIMLDA